jgi:tRNA modification GTPase
LTIGKSTKLPAGFNLNPAFLKAFYFKALKTNHTFEKKIMFQDTICSISTPPGNGAISIIRLSGDNAYSICTTIFIPKGKDSGFKKKKLNSLSFGQIKNNEEIIDEVIVGLFKSPNSYTGEDIVEISCHGSDYIQQKILELLVQKGARLAKPGEFTMRAFLNGKMDLSQAEAVADLIASSNKSSHKLAMQQMRGGFKNEISHLRKRLLHFISLLELELDFSEEDVEFADRSNLKSLLSEIFTKVTSLLESFKLGNVIKNGLPVAIVGRSNVGKSTLLNLLLKEEKAIVSDIAGTTRDVIEDVISIEGISFRFIDTAGIRETTDTIETLGIERTFNRIDNASVVLLLVDASENIDEIMLSLAKVEQRIQNTDKKLIVLINKTDLIPDDKLAEMSSFLVAKSSVESEQVLQISAKKVENIDLLIKMLINTVNISQLNSEDVIVTNIRHFEALQHASTALIRASEGMENDLPSDLLAQDVREVLHYLGEITGEISNDEILGNIFKNFCIGK